MLKEGENPLYINKSTISRHRGGWNDILLIMRHIPCELSDFDRNYLEIEQNEKEKLLS